MGGQNKEITDRNKKVHPETNTVKKFAVGKEAGVEFVQPGILAGFGTEIIFERNPIIRKRRTKILHVRRTTTGLKNFYPRVKKA